jgi:hypothetical protein
MSLSFLLILFGVETLNFSFPQTAYTKHTSLRILDARQEWRRPSGVATASNSSGDTMTRRNNTSRVLPPTPHFAKGGKPLYDVFNPLEHKQLPELSLSRWLGGFQGSPNQIMIQIGTESQEKATIQAPFLDAELLKLLINHSNHYHSLSYAWGCSILPK